MSSYTPNPYGCCPGRCVHGDVSGSEVRLGRTSDALFELVQCVDVMRDFIRTAERDVEHGEDCSWTDIRSSVTMLEDAVAALRQEVGRDG